MTTKLMTNGRWRLLGGLAAGTMATAGAVAIAPPASAAVTCTYDLLTRTASVSVSDESVSIATSGLLITVNGTPCGLATTLTTDTIEVTGSPEHEQVELSAGLATNSILVEVKLGGQPTTTPQYVRLIGTAGADMMAIGGLGADQDGDGEVDVTIDQTSVWSPSTGEGGDTVTGQGSAGTGGATERRMVILGGPGSDLLTGGSASSDHLFGGPGDDHLDGGAGGADTARYDNAEDGVKVDLAAGSATGGDGTDSLKSIEYAVGSADNDILLGNDRDNALEGLEGCDEIEGHAGTDRVSFNNSPDPVEVDLRSQSASTTGCDEIETFSNIEGVVGSHHDDTLIGDDGPNSLDGLGGNDILVGLGDDDVLDGWDGTDALSGGPGDDRIQPGSGDDIAHGDTGADTIEYGAMGGVTVDLSAGTAGDAAGNDTLSGFENVIGSPFDDTLTGDDGPNVLTGLGGDDQLDGGEGTDACDAGGDAGDSTANCE